VFFLLGEALAAESVSSLNIILEFCAPEDRPTYIGLTNTLLAPTRTVAPLLGGWLATWLGYPPLFAAALALSIIGSLMLFRWLREPRLLAHRIKTMAAVNEQRARPDQIDMP
jgi:MFS family permease